MANISRFTNLEEGNLELNLKVYKIEYKENNM